MSTVPLLDVANDRPADRIHGWRARLAVSFVGLGPFEEATRAFKRSSTVSPKRAT